jgi:hypothetical protein
VSRYLRQSVIDHFREYTEQFEGRIHTMYADVLGLVTTGVGNLIDPVSAALTLKWRFADGGLAPASQISAEWHALKARALEMAHHNPGTQAAMCGLTLHLDDAEIDQLFYGRLESNARDVTARHFPRFPDMSADAQLGIMSLAWAAGSDWPRKFPHAKGAILAGDWTHAAIEAVLADHAPNGTPNPGVIPRNNAQKICFANAAAVQIGSLDPSRLYWPAFPYALPPEGLPVV